MTFYEEKQRILSNNVKKVFSRNKTKQKLTICTDTKQEK